MKLRNKKTGEIGEFFCSGDPCMEEITLGVEFENGETVKYNSLSKMTEEWEDYEKPKENYWYIDADGEVCSYYATRERTKELREIGNYFETREEAEKAVEKLKALTRLRKKGFKFTGFSEGKIEFKLNEEYSEFTYNGYDEGCEWYINSEVNNDLEFLFGGEE